MISTCVNRISFDFCYMLYFHQWIIEDMPLTWQGMVFMALGAGIPSLRPPSCPTQSNCIEPTGSQLAILYSGLALFAIGSGGLRPCNIAFGADQFDTKTEKGRAQLESFCNWWYFLFTVALLVALTVVVYIQTNISWFLGFVIPTVCFAFSLTISCGDSTHMFARSPKEASSLTW